MARSRPNNCLSYLFLFPNFILLGVSSFFCFAAFSAYGYFLGSQNVYLTRNLKKLLVSCSFLLVVNCGVSVSFFYTYPLIHGIFSGGLTPKPGAGGGSRQPAA